jgi:hypothetical protein
MDLPKLNRANIGIVEERKQPNIQSMTSIE